jgi:hypothetical protein
MVLGFIVNKKAWKVHDFCQKYPKTKLGTSAFFRQKRFSNVAQFILQCGIVA